MYSTSDRYQHLPHMYWTLWIHVAFERTKILHVCRVSFKKNLKIVLDKPKTAWKSILWHR